MLGMMAQGFGFCGFVSALPQMAVTFGTGGEFVAQMTIACVALGLMFGALVSGRVLEAAGSRYTLLLSIVIYGLAGSGGLFINEPSLLLGACFAIGFTTSCMVTTCMWGIATEYRDHRRATALGSSTAFANVTSLIGIMLGGYLARSGGWHLSFLQFPIFAVFAFALTLTGIKQARPLRESVGSKREPYLRRLLPLYLMSMLLFAVIFMGSTQFVFLLVDDGITDPASRSFVMSIVTVAAAVAGACYGVLQQRIGVLGCFVVSLLSMAAGLTTAALTSSPRLAMLAAALIGIYAGLVFPYVYHVVTERTDEYTRSRAIGMLTAFAFLGGFTNPLIFSPLAKAIGLRMAFLSVAAVLTLLMIGTFIRAARARRNPSRTPVGSVS
jgi:MFS family permease